MKCQARTGLNGMTFECAVPGQRHQIHYAAHPDDFTIRWSDTSSPQSIPLYDIDHIARMSGDENFRIACSSGDVHTAVAQVLFISEDGAIRDDLKDSDTAKTKGKPLRQAAKLVVFAITAGHTEADTICEILNENGYRVSYLEAFTILERFEKHFSRYGAFCSVMART